MRKCEHGIYIPAGDEIAIYCQSCNPAKGVEAAPTKEQIPQFNRRNSLHLTVTGKLPKCPTCAIPLSIAMGGKCIRCGETFEINPVDNLRANNIQSGSCPACGSGIHYLAGKQWECADCGTLYKAPKKSE